MVRVLNVMDTLDVGGLETTVMHHYRQINRELVQFDFLLSAPGPTYYEEEAIALGANIYRRPRRAQNILKCQRGLYSLLRQNPNIKVVHIHGESPILGLDALTARLAGVKVRMVHSRSAQPQKANKQALLRPMLRRCATHWLACSTQAGVSLFGGKAPQSPKFLLLPNARPLQPYLYNQSVRATLRQNMGADTKLVLLTVGRLHPVKNQAFLLDVLAALQNIPAVLWIAGEGEEREPLENAVRAKGLQNKVRFLGRRNDVPALLQAADVFLLPSLLEGMPGAVVEAQTAGLPCLVSDTVTPECKLTSLVSFLPIDAGAEPWAKQISQLAKQLPGRNLGGEVLTSGYDIEVAAKNLQDIYLKAAGKKG